MNRFRNAKICDNNALEKATVTAPESSPYVFSNAIDLINRNRTWKPGVKTLTIEIDLLSNSQNVSFFAMLGESDDKFKLSNSAVVTLKASSINLFDGSEPYTATANVEDLGCYLNISDKDNMDGISYRFWNIVIEDEENPEDIEIAYIYLGDNVIIHRNINNGWNYQAFDRTLSNTSDSGKYYALKKPDQTFIRALSYQIMEKQDKDNVIALVRKNGLHTPFLFVIDPDQCQDDLDFSVRACYFDRQAPTITHVILGYYNTTYNLREVM